MKLLMTPLISHRFDNVVYEYIRPMFTLSSHLLVLLLRSSKWKPIRLLQNATIRYI